MKVSKMVKILFNLAVDDPDILNYEIIVRNKDREYKDPVLHGRRDTKQLFIDLQEVFKC